MSVEIRRGTPSDTDFLAWVMLAASRGHVTRGFWDLIVSSNDASCLEYLKRLVRAEPAALCHYGSFLVAESEGRPAAALCTFHPAEGGWTAVGRAMSKVQTDLGWTAKDVAASEERLAPVLACMPPDVGADWCIEFVATLPQHRRQGLADALMRAAIREGIRRGCSRAQIMIFIGNDPAEKAYEKVGFVVHDDHKSPGLQIALGVPGFRRLLREL